MEHSPAIKSAETCSGCGRKLPSNAPAGLCPTCLMGQGVQLVSATGGKPGQFVPPDMDELGLLFPEFEFLEILGHGGMGAVYKAVQLEIDRTVAVKILPPETANDPEFTERFRREAAILAQFDHPHIIKLYDFGQRERFTYIVMEFVEGDDLARRMLKERITPEQSLGYVEQICDALAHSHARGFVHRDIKPANILIAPDGSVKVADFGLARLVKQDGSEPGITRTNATLGTPLYMAPEQMERGKELDERVDIYAVGVMLYEMLTGMVPAGHFDPPSEKVSGLNRRIDPVILRSLRRDPQERFGSVVELKDALREAIENPGLTREQEARSVVVKALVASLVAAILCGGFVFVWVNRSTDDGDSVSGPSASERLGGAGSVSLLGNPDAALASLQGVELVELRLSASAGEFALGVGKDGRLQALGNNRFGQLELPLEHGVIIDLAVGQGARSAHALAVQENGQVIGWGDNTLGQAAPPAEATNVISVAAGQFHSLALRKDGSVVAWGKSVDGALAIPDFPGPVSAIAAGEAFSVALLEGGALQAWGANDRRQLEVPSVTGVVEVAVGHAHGIARLEGGRVVAWGRNDRGQCDVPDDMDEVERVFAGADGSAAITTTGQLYVWGEYPSKLDAWDKAVEDVAIGSRSWALILRP